MGKHFDIGYFKKPVKVRAKVAQERTIINKMNAWKLGKEYYDGNRLDGYGGFKYDGRWKKLLPKIIKKYKLTNKSRVLDLGCKKGFLLKDINILLPGIKSYGIENHPYALKKAVDCKSKLIESQYYNIPFKNNYFDFVIAFNSIYKNNFGETIKSIREISRVTKKNNSLISIPTYQTNLELSKFLNWTLIGTTICKKNDWLTVFKKINYKGDYYFTTVKSLGL